MPSPLEAFLAERYRTELNTYSGDRERLNSDAKQEDNILASGYLHRQISELVQNGADAIREALGQNSGPETTPHQIEVRLTETHLYVANTGAPITEKGIGAILTFTSTKTQSATFQVGRFGLGFKSLLSLGGKIDIFSKTSGHTRFDPERCRAELRQRFPGSAVPALRLAWPLADTEQDDVTRELFGWAETIVRVEVPPRHFDSLARGIDEFRPEFMLFMPGTLSLRMDDGRGRRLDLSVTCQGRHKRILRVGDEKMEWRIYSRAVTVADPQALEEAKPLQLPSSVEVTYALPVGAKQERTGEFWAFFPTKSRTWLKGILNAPWLLFSDRQNLHPGRWNSALMEEAGILIGEALLGLASRSDPGKPLDAFPRQPDAGDNIATPLLEATWRTIAGLRIIADAEGTLRLPHELWRPPYTDGGVLERWLDCAPTADLGCFTHPSCLRGERASRLEALAKRLTAGDAAARNLALWDKAKWLNSLATKNRKKLLAVLQLVAACRAAENHYVWISLKPQLALVPTDGGEFSKPNEALFGPSGTAVPGFRMVEARFQEDPEICRLLSDVLGVKALSDAEWITSLKSRSHWGESFWLALRRCPEGAAEQVLRDCRLSVKLKRRDGSWAAINESLLPGGLIRVGDGTEAEGFLVDTTWHADDARWLDVLKVGQWPDGIRESGDWIAAWRDRAKELFLERHSYSRGAPLKVDAPKVQLPNAAWFLMQASGKPATRCTTWLLGLPAYPAEIPVTHPRKSPVHVPHPLYWLLMERGQVQVGSALTPLRVAYEHLGIVGMNRLGLPEGASVHCEGLARAARDMQAATEQELRAFWTSVVDLLANAESVRTGELSDLWSAAAKSSFVPDSLPYIDAPTSIAEFYVSDDPRKLALADRAGVAVAFVPYDAVPLWIEKGAQNLNGAVKLERELLSAVSIPMMEAFPELAPLIAEIANGGVLVTKARKLSLAIGHVREPVACIVWEEIFYAAEGPLASMPRRERLQALLKALRDAELLELDVDEALAQLIDQGWEERCATVRSIAPLSDKIVECVGGKAERLRAVLGAVGDAPFASECSVHQLALIALSQLGPTLLGTLRESLAEEGFCPPERWGGEKARDLVTKLGFPIEFADSAQGGREAEEWVSGPIPLPPLHDYQKDVVEAVGELLATQDRRRRAIINLPTGGGKTRVAVQIAVDCILRPAAGPRSVLWIAQSDELCEQAVQAFMQVWANCGAVRIPLRIARLWGGNRTPTPPQAGEPLVVVTSIQTLNNRVGYSLDWLQQPGLVVIDECHHAITKSYTAVLRWLDADGGVNKKDAKPEPPLLGLSATPFRRNDEESMALARRFDERIFPLAHENLHARLVERGVLARLQTEALDSGERLTEQEARELEQLGEGLSGFEAENLLRRIDERMAEIEARNQLILKAIASASERSILVFANSVQHARELSAQLNLRGIPSGVIDQDTPRQARRYFLEKFQRQELRVLCNHSVLTTGFDAPRTDLIVITRLVFSPVRYTQIIGRGLRGPLAGGTARCRVLSIEDNLGRFDEFTAHRLSQRYYNHAP